LYLKGLHETTRDLLRARLDDLNGAFSESRYPEFKKKFLSVKDDARILNRQAEWALNKGLYGQGRGNL
jgi:hypothetical protein